MQAMSAASAALHSGVPRLARAWHTMELWAARRVGEGERDDAAWRDAQLCRLRHTHARLR